MVAELHRGKGARAKPHQTKWQEKHARARQVAGVGPEDCPWKGATWGLETPRCKDMVQAACALILKDKAHPEEMVLDVSQCISRRPWGQKCRSMTTSSQYFVFSRGRVATPSEQFHLMGLSGICLHSISSSQARDLCGEAMAAPSVAVCVLAMAACLDEIWE